MAVAATTSCRSVMRNPAISKVETLKKPGAKDCAMPPVHRLANESRTRPAPKLVMREAISSSSVGSRRRRSG